MNLAGAQQSTASFDEDEWMKLLFLISDTQGWVDKLSREIVARPLAATGRKNFTRTFYLTASTVAHILEKHYYKIQRHPESGKFIIPVADILSYLRAGFLQTPLELPGSQNLLRVVEADRVIGIDRQGSFTRLITIVTNPAGLILTAFPGLLKK